MRPEDTAMAGGDNAGTENEYFELRDYFAAKALQGICASGQTSQWTNYRIAAEAYQIADAMLKAREA